MSLVSTQHSFNNNNNTNSITTATTNSLLASTEVDSNPTHDTEADLSRLLGAFTGSEKSSMERGAPDFQQSGLQSPFSSALNEPQSEESPADHASAAHYPPQHELRPSNPNNYSTSATPTSEFYPASARSSSFPEHIHRNIQSSNHSGSSGAMAQQPTSPSLPLQDGQRNHQNPQIKSDSDVPIDPSIATSSPTYPPNGGQYSPYPPNQEMHHGGYPPQQHPGAMYAQPRPDWAGYGGHPQHVPAGYGVSGAQTPTSAAPAGQRPGQVYSFVPIPGAQQHKRPRRRYEEIERMYKCGWNGCEKAYGTLNHLNAHVTMQSHGIKRTPEEFKEIRKEWKQRKKEEEAQRKAEDERARQAAGGADGQQPDGAAPSGYRQPAQVQLPPLTYQPGTQGPTQYQAPAGGVQQLQEYGQQSHQPMFNGYPASPYGAPNPMYNQHQGNPAGQPQPKYEPHN